jgi:hypothetical protein
MNHLKNYLSFIKESFTSDPSRIQEFLDGVSTLDAGKLLQRILKVNPTPIGNYLDFDKVFRSVKTGRIYIGASYGAKTRIYYDNKNLKWRQESEASGGIYGKGESNTLEGIIKFCVTRFVTLNLELGIDKKQISNWMDSNWNLLYTLSSVKEIIDEFKKSTGGPIMITDPNVILNLPSYKMLDKLFIIQSSPWGPTALSLSINLNPLEFENEKFIRPFQVRLTNKKGYSYDSNFDGVKIGADSIEDLDKKFIKGVKSFVDKMYEKSSPFYSNTQRYKNTTLSLLGGYTQNDQSIEDHIIDLSKSKPLTFSKIMNLLQNKTPTLFQSISQKTGQDFTNNLLDIGGMLRGWGIGD